MRIRSKTVITKRIIGGCTEQQRLAVDIRRFYLRPRKGWKLGAVERRGVSRNIWDRVEDSVTYA